MRQPSNFDPAYTPPLAKRRCPSCGKSMFLLSIEPTEEKGSDRHTFECSSCPYAETTIVKIAFKNALCGD